jgi:hypothetical protein
MHAHGPLAAIRLAVVFGKAGTGKPVVFQLQAQEQIEDNRAAFSLPLNMLRGARDCLWSH